MKQMKYMKDRSINGLETRLNEALSEGWELFGNLTHLSGSYIQAVTKEDQFWNPYMLKTNAQDAGKRLVKAALQSKERVYATSAGYQKWKKPGAGVNEIPLPIKAH